MASSPNPAEPATPRALATQHNELEALRRQVVELQRVSSLGVLSGSIVHELNNALTPILNYAKLGLRNSDPDFRRKAFEKILEGAQRPPRSPPASSASPDPTPTAATRPTSSGSSRTSCCITAKDLQKHRVRVEFRAEGRPHARVNPAQIQQVLLNLVINARQAMPDGGLLTIAVAPDPSGRFAELRVTRHRRRHPARRPAAHLRALLHHQDRPRRHRPRRHRPRPARLPRHHRGPQGPPPRREPPRPGGHLHPPTPLLPRPLPAPPGGRLIDASSLSIRPSTIEPSTRSLISLLPLPPPPPPDTPPATAPGTAPPAPPASSAARRAPTRRGPARGPVGAWRASGGRRRRRPGAP